MNKVEVKYLTILVTTAGKRITSDQRDGLFITIIPTTSGDNVSNIIVQWRNDGKDINFNLSRDFFGEMVGAFNKPFFNYKETNLLTFLNNYLRDLTQEEKRILNDCYPESENIPDDGYQRLLNIFVIDWILYLVAIEILVKHPSWLEEALFTLPFDCLNSQIYYQNTLKYLALPIEAILKSRTISNTRFILYNNIIEFINRWEILFVPGPELSYNKVMLETIQITSNETIKYFDSLQQQQKKRDLAIPIPIPISLAPSSSSPNSKESERITLLEHKVSHLEKENEALKNKLNLLTSQVLAIQEQIKPKTVFQIRK